MKKLVIPDRMPGLNKVLGRANANRYAGGKLKKEWTERVAWECKTQDIGKLNEPVELEFRWFEPNRKRDPDNFTSAGRKLLLDGLQMAGCLRNDGWKNIAGFSDKWSVDKDNPRVVVIIKEDKK